AVNGPTSTYNTIIFLHIGACGGSTLHPVLERKYPPGKVFTIDWRKPVSAFTELPASARQNVALLKGHLTYGIHEYVRQPATYFTFMRDPVQRIISHYYFVVRSPLHRYHDTVVTNGMSLHDYVKSGLTVEVDNWQVRALSGNVDCPFGSVDETLLDRARANISSQFAVVGLTERYDESLVLLRRAFGWSPLWYTKENVGINRPRSDEIPESVLANIRDSNSWDVALYHEMLQEFQVRTANRQFEREVARFRFQNNAYHRWRLLCRSAKRRLPLPGKPSGLH
ncbi:MAG: sulfotransferase family 2 domain-containing protein, partial [Actinobacteria bacterium]|nr:sulfotransferase family 2 domain-containing protein [Actinomycetota bacterium]